MSKTSFHLLRVGLGITFVWIGVLIFRDPEVWGSLLLPWAANLLFIPLRTAMIETAVLDIIIGFLLLVDAWTWLAALLASLHLLIVLITTGISEITVRDVGLIAAALGLTLDALPAAWRKKLLPGEGM